MLPDHQVPGSLSKFTFVPFFLFITLPVDMQHIYIKTTLSASEYMPIYLSIERELSESANEGSSPDILDPRCITPVERAREKRKIRKEKTNTSLSHVSKKVEFIVKA